MKRIMIVGLLILSIAKASAQDDLLTKEARTEKSIRQKKTALILLAAGTTVALTGIIVGSQEDKDELGFGQNFETGMFLTGAGITASLVSIPFFISSANNKRAAAAIGMNRMTPMQLDPAAKRTYAAIRIVVFLR